MDIKTENQSLGEGGGGGVMNGVQFSLLSSNASAWHSKVIQLADKCLVSNTFVLCISTYICFW